MPYPAAQARDVACSKVLEAIDPTQEYCSPRLLSSPKSPFGLRLDFWIFMTRLPSTMVVPELSRSRWKKVSVGSTCTWCWLRIFYVLGEPSDPRIICPNFPSISTLMFGHRTIFRRYQLTRTDTSQDGYLAARLQSYVYTLHPSIFRKTGPSISSMYDGNLHGKAHTLGRNLPERWVKRHHEEVHCPYINVLSTEVEHLSTHDTQH